MVKGKIDRKNRQHLDKRAWLKEPEFLKAGQRLESISRLKRRGQQARLLKLVQEARL